MIGQTNTKDNRTQDKFRFQLYIANDDFTTSRNLSRWQCKIKLMREDIPKTKRLRNGFMVNTDKEYMSKFSLYNQIEIWELPLIMIAIWGWGLD